MNQVKLHNGELAKNASLKKLNESIDWFSKTIEKFNKEGINLVDKFEEWKSQLLSYRSDRIGKKK